MEKNTSIGNGNLAAWDRGVMKLRLLLQHCIPSGQTQELKHQYYKTANQDS